MSKRLLLPLLSSLLLASLAHNADADTEQNTALSSLSSASLQERVEQRSCHLKGLSKPMTCGTLQAPLDHGLPDGEQLSLNFAVLPAIKRASQSDPLIFLAGGPGQSAVSVAREIYYTFHDIRRSRDIILLDQRGTGESFALNCWDGQGSAQQSGPTANQAQVHAEAIDELLGVIQLGEAEISECLDSLKAKNAQLEHFTTENNIHDVELLRQALGYQQVNLYGGSYGSRAALSYLRLYPDSLRSVVLDAVAPIDVPIGAFGQSAARAFEMMLEACEQDTRCQQGFPKLREEFSALMARVEVEPISQAISHPHTGAPAEFVLDKLKLVNLLRLSLYQPQGRSMMPLMIHQANKGNLQPLLGIALQSGGMAGLSHGLHINIVCNEDYPRLSAEDLEQDSNNSFGGDASHTLYNTACPMWPRYTPQETLYQALNSQVPTLLLSGDYDPVTPPSNAEVALRGFSNARHITAEHGAHAVAFHTCAKQIVSDFIDTPKPDELDVSCLDEAQPVAFVLDINASY